MFRILLLSLLLADPAIRLTATPAFSYEPARIHVQVRIPRHPDNRGFCIWIAGEAFESSSCNLNMEGETSPSVFEYDFKDIPASQYTLQGALYRQGDEIIRSSTFHLIVISGIN